MHLAAALTPAKAHEPDEQVQIMRLLIECGGEVTILNERQESCIHYAAREGATLQLQHIISSISAIEAQITCNALAKVRFYKFYILLFGQVLNLNLLHRTVGVPCFTPAKVDTVTQFNCCLNKIHVLTFLMK